MYLFEQELYDLLARGDDTRIYHTDALEPTELEAYCMDDNHALEVGKIWFACFNWKRVKNPFVDVFLPPFDA